MCAVDAILFPGWTPLMQASYSGSLSAVKCLLEQKANIEAKDSNGKFLNFATAVLSGLFV